MLVRPPKRTSPDPRPCSTYLTPERTQVLASPRGVASLGALVRLHPDVHERLRRVRHGVAGEVHVGVLHQHVPQRVPQRVVLAVGALEGRKRFPSSAAGP